MSLSTLGFHIREQRKAHGMTSEQLAELCNVGAVHIRKIESGAKTPSLNLFIRLCNSLRISPQYLLQDELEPHESTRPLQLSNELSRSTCTDISEIPLQCQREETSSKKE